MLCISLPANFDQADIGKPILEVVLEAGDLLYFPRGFIHQGDCLPDAHSLHITISSHQKNSWGELLQKLVPAALEIAMEEDVEFRQGLPLDYLTYMGVQNSDKDDPRRTKFFSRIESLMKKLITYAPVDAAVDQKARDFLHDCLPPMLTPEELASSVQGASTRWERGQVLDIGAQITTQTRVRILRAGCARQLQSLPQRGAQEFRNKIRAHRCHGVSDPFISQICDSRKFPMRFCRRQGMLLDRFG
ncbi:hypothetical protein FQN60_015602 [Etheostoma spectabile]|uniref:Bifunctional lysine-specific demethylase and histidyl-hydroxylase n=1 Tax=Etheostoma spectabile TaxID=54343 RepID=A0A5J5CR00_9PERO|nr:hypothetical protein FQN60_015602 [Etheostoma spectabile]